MLTKDAVSPIMDGPMVWEDKHLIRAQSLKALLSLRRLDQKPTGLYAATVLQTLKDLFQSVARTSPSCLRKLKGSSPRRPKTRNPSNTLSQNQLIPLTTLGTAVTQWKT